MRGWQEIIAYIVVLSAICYLSTIHGCACNCDPLPDCVDDCDEAPECIRACGDAYRSRP